MLYGKFVEAEGALAFQLDFLAKAIGDNETRFYMNYIHIEPSDKGDGLLGIATDGRHLHLVDQLDNSSDKIYGMTAGYWKVFKANTTKRVWIARLEDSQTNGCLYPNWRNVIPKGEVNYKTTFEGFSFKGFRKGYGELASFIHSFPEPTAINLEYLETLGIGFTWNVEWYNPNKTLKFTEGSRMALIQPMLID